MNIRAIFFVVFIGIFILIALLGQLFSPIFGFYLITIPLFLIGCYDIVQKKKTILRNFPLLGHFRYLFLIIRPELHQYFVEGNRDGRPYSWEGRTLAYQRSHNQIDTMPFGTRIDVEKIGYEWINHSMSPLQIEESNFRVVVGNDKTTPQDYSASILNISAMSYGALSKNAILSLNAGAKIGQFAHNTGEGGLSPYHEKNGGDLIWQIGTARFGVRTKDGEFCSDTFKKKCQNPAIKMIEIKLSQGAKPGHGGVLPGAKVNAEIAEIRGVEIGKTVISPPSHPGIDNPIDLLNWVKELRDLSEGKPIGFKICLGKRREFFAICKAMIETNIKPDFITVDGGEGGTGSAPVEFSNSIGTPLVEALIQVNNALTGFNLRNEIKIIASAKMMTGFHIVRALSLGADMINIARGFMFSLGCIQALKCNTDECPTGVATQNPVLGKGLSVSSKKLQVANFHQELLNSVREILNSAGISEPNQLRRWHILKRIDINKVLNYAELYPYLEPGCFLKEPTTPDSYKRVLSYSNSKSFGY